jgi:hypothetical protein
MNKRNIPKAFFEPFEEVESSNLLENKDLIKMIKKETPIAIEEALREKKTFATIFEIGGTGYFIDIPKQYWIDALEQCINFNLEDEKFEDCVSLKKLIDEIKKPITKIPKPTKSKQNGTRANRNPISDQSDSERKESGKEEEKE